MTRIVGTIADAKQPLDGVLIVALDAPIVDRSVTPNRYLTTEPHRFEVTNGAIDIELVPSGSNTYHFKFALVETRTQFYQNGNERYFGDYHEQNGEFFTGLTHTEDSKPLYRLVIENDRVIQDFHARVDDLDRIEFSNLVPTGITRDLLDSSISRIVELLVTDPRFTQKIETAIASAAEIAFAEYDDITASDVQSALQQLADKRLKISENLADVDPAIARENLGLGDAATTNLDGIASATHLHPYGDLILDLIESGAGKCVIENAPAGVYGNPAKWLVIQKSNGFDFIIPCWKYSNSS